MADKNADKARQQAQQTQNRARSEAEDAEATNDGIGRAPDSMSTERGGWNAGQPQGETSQDPLGTGTGESGPGNFIQDRTDNRAIGKQSQAGVRDRSLGDVDDRDARKNRETQSPRVDALRSVIATGVPATKENPLGIQPREVEYLEGETVMLTASHYINDVLYESGTVLEDYTGPKSRNMRIAEDGDFTTAAAREEIRRKEEKRSATTFRARGR